MNENHQREQYWFDLPTRRFLVRLVRQYQEPLLLCCPMLGYEMALDRNPPLVLDIDRRFVGEPWFREWNLHRPQAMFKPDLVVFDPPFTTVKLDRLWNAIRVLVMGDWTTPMVVVWPKYREADLLGTFHQAGLKPTGIIPGYLSCSPGAEFYANFDLEG